MYLLTFHISLAGRLLTNGICKAMRCEIVLMNVL
jgi:hypothetical protein